MIIGDGFDDVHVTMGRNYLSGQGGTLTLDTMPFRGAVQVETVDDNGTPIYVADSANTATTLATGRSPARAIRQRGERLGSRSGKRCSTLESHSPIRKP